MITIPPYLQPGDCIGIVCPSGYMPYEKAQTCINTLQQWGFTVKVGKTLGNQFNYFAGTDEERLTDLQQMLDDDSVKAILCGRGGYGLSRIIDAIDFTRFAQRPKWIIGFSDVTVLLAHVYEQLHIATLHSPMAAAFNDGGANKAYVQSLRHALTGKPAHYTVDAHTYNRAGKATATLVGGNLAMVAHLIGSPSAYNTNNKILFLEDIGEYIYNIDRMFLQLKRSGMLQQLAGLIVGGFTDMKDTTIPFGDDVYHIIHEHVKEYNYPVGFNFPVSHDTTNYALKIGGVYTLRVGDEVVLSEEV